MAERIGHLEKQIAEFEQWETEKKKYDLKEIHPHFFAYAIKENARGPEPSHLVCAKCFEDRKKYILQKSSAIHMACPNCKSMIEFKDSGPSRSSYSPREGGW